MNDDEIVLQLQPATVENSRSPGNPTDRISLTLKVGEVRGIVSSRTYDSQRFVNLFIGHKPELSPLITLRGQSQPSAAQAQIAAVVPGNTLFSNMSIAQNLFFQDTHVFHRSRRVAQAKAEAELEALGIQLNFGKSVDQLSRDEVQLVSILRAYFMQTPIVLFYDTLGQLSNERIFDFYKILKKLRKRGAGILYVTSKIDDALKIADSVSVLDNNTLKDTFTVDEIRKKPRSILYLLSGWENLFKKADEENDEVLETLINAREIMTSNFELNAVLKYLADNATKALDGSRCQIYLVDNNQKLLLDMIDTRKGSQAEFRLPFDDVFAYLRKGTRFVLQKGGAGFPAQAAGFSTLAGVPVSSKMEVSALVLMSFVNEHTLSQKDHLYLSTFSKEIAIALETSELMGHSVLLQESHHRIKNSLQIIINLLYLQKAHFSGENAGKVNDSFDMIISRVKSIAAMHDLLAKDNLGKSAISLSQIVKKIVGFYNLDTVTIHLDIGSFSIPYNRAVSISMVVNELLSNSVKHAFADKLVCQINISCTLVGDNLEICVRDNGVGYPPNFLATHTDSVGLSIVDTVVRSLHGKIAYYNDGGAVTHILLPQDYVSGTNLS